MVTTAAGTPGSGGQQLANAIGTANTDDLFHLPREVGTSPYWQTTSSRVTQEDWGAERTEDGTSPEFDGQDKQKDSDAPHRAAKLAHEVATALSDPMWRRQRRGAQARRPPAAP